MAAKDTQPVGMLLNAERCTGCYSCQSACRDANQVPYEEKWLEVVRRKPVLVDGDLSLYHLLAPTLSKCAACVEKENPPLCVRVCMASCLYVAPVEKLLPLLKDNGKWVLYAP
jgi:anaerobic dimethyl sulfoxide reductase subunit B (iron-sulfur subunit)